MQTILLVQAGSEAGPPSASADRYASLTGAHSSAALWNSSAGPARTRMPFAGTMSNLRVTLENPPGLAASGKSYTFTIYKNGVAQTLTTAISETATTNADTTNSFSFAAGDDIAILCSPANTPDGTGAVQIAMVAESTTPGTGAFFCFHAASASAGFIQPGGASGVSDTESAVQVPAPTSGTLTAIYARRDTAPGSGNTMRYAIRKGGVDAITCDVAGTSQTGEGTGSVAFVAGDLLSIGITIQAGTPVSSTGCIAVAYAPDTSGYGMQFGVWSSSPSQAADAFGNACGRQGNGSQVETEYPDVAPIAFTARDLRAKVTTAPSSGKSRTFTFRKEFASTAMTCSIADADTTSPAASSTVSVAAGERITLMTSPVNTPTAPGVTAYGWVASTAAAAASGLPGTMLLLGVG